MSILHNKTASATHAYFDEKLIHVWLSDGREISAPLEWFPRLQQATPEQREQWELMGRSSGIHWGSYRQRYFCGGIAWAAARLTYTDHCASCKERDND